MSKKLSYNQMRCVILVSETVYVLMSIMAIVILKENEPILLALIKILVQLIAIVTSLFASGRRDTPGYIDEMADEHDRKASEMTLGLFLLIVSALYLFTLVFDINISISPELLICMVFAIYTMRDAYYLYLEKEGTKDAQIDNKN